MVPRLKQLARILLVLPVMIAGTAGAKLVVTEQGDRIAVRTAAYSLVFDKSRGGTIVEFGGKAVAQRDRADDYLLANDTRPVVTIRRQQDQATITVTAFYVRDGEKAPSQIRARYRYRFHDQSPVVGCNAWVDQGKTVAHTDVFVAPAWSRLCLLDFGEQVAECKPFAREGTRQRLHFTPGKETLFDVPDDEVRRFAALTRPEMPTTGLLMQDDFADLKRWTPVAGSWETGGRQLTETSPQLRHAWIVTGEEDWDNCMIETGVWTNDDGHVYLCGRWQDADNHYALTYMTYPANTVRIERVRDGKRVTLAEIRNMPNLRMKPPTRLTFYMRGPHLMALRNDEVLLEAYDDSLQRGRVALGAICMYGFWFNDFQVHGLPPPADTIAAVSIGQPATRHAYYREEADAVAPFIISVDRDVDDLVVAFALTNDKYPTQGTTHAKTVRIGKLAAGEHRPVGFPLQPANWRSGDYTLTVAVSQGDRVLARDRTVIYLRRKPNPERMLVNAWDTGDAGLLAAHGFNQFKVHHDNTMSRWNGDKYLTPDVPTRLLRPSAARKRQYIYDQFDECVKHGMWAYVQLEYMRRVAEGVEAAYALKRDGKSFQDHATGSHEANHPRPNPWHPKNIEVIQEFWRGALPLYKELVAWHGILLNSESENSFDVYGNDYWLEMAEKELGFPVPADVTRSWGVKPREHPLPDNGIVESDDPYYLFYRWWWERGEGQGMLHSKVADVVRESRPDVRIWHDPALRQPFVRGRLKGMDQLLQWTYTWPSPERIPLVADELRCAAVDDQETVLNLQLIVWGAVAIPSAGPHWPYIKKDSYLAAHSPAVMRQAAWMALSRGVSGISYHGLESVETTGLRTGDDRAAVRGVGYRSYMYSNPETLTAIKDLNLRVVRPYGMVIKQLRPRKADVAMLLSTATSVLAYKDAMDFRAGEAGHMYAKLQAAHIPVDVVYEVDLEETGLAHYKAIALPGCRVLPRHIYDTIRAFARNGGIIIADQHLVASFEEVIDLEQKAGAWSPGDRVQSEILGDAGVLRDALDGRIQRWADCDSPSVALSVLQDGDNQLLFVTNTLKQRGDYIGGWGKVLGDGVPQKVRVSIRRTDCVVYDVLERRLIDPQRTATGHAWDVDLGPGQGRMFAILPEAIGSLRVKAPDAVEKGNVVDVAVAVAGKRGARLEGLVPLEVTIRNSQGSRHDYSDYAVARNGAAAVRFPIALNEPAGHWSVEVRELYGGAVGRTFFRVDGSRDETAAAPPKPSPRGTPGFVEVPELWNFRRGFRKRGEEENWHLPDTDLAAWQRISTHAFWDDAVGLFEGNGWYAIDIVIPPAAGKNVKLAFGAVDENYTLWINGDYISDNLAAGTTMWDQPVSVDITKRYRPGQKNRIVVRVHNSLRAGGIWKPIRLIAE
jgi:hypothetical protein